MAHIYPNWYWQVNDSSPATTRWQGSSGSFVPTSDADYVAFLAEGNSATVIDTFANLCIVINDWNRTLWQAGQFLGVKTWPVGSAIATNPMVGIQKVTPNIGSGATFQLPQMNLFGSIPIGMQILILRGGNRQDPDLTVVANDGSTVVTTISRSGGYDMLLELIGNSTANGTFATQIMLDSILPLAPLLGGTGFQGAPTDAQILVGNNTNTYTPQSVSGDATLADTGGLTIATHAVSNAKFRQGVARSLVGVTGNATADVADIQGTANQIPIVNSAGTALAFTTVSGDLTNASGAFTIASAAVTYAKMQNVAASRLLGNPTGSAAAPSEISLGATLAFSGTALQTAALTGDVTASANSFATTLANIPNDVPMAGDLLATNIANPAAPAAGKTRIFVTLADGTLAAINQAGTLSYTARVFTAPTHQFVTAFAASGAFSAAQPAFSDLSGTIANSQFGTQTANTIYGGPTSGGAANPTFRALVGADLPNPSATTLGGIESLASTASKWINAISTSGVPSATQPAATDLSDYANSTWTPSDQSGASPALTFSGVSVNYTKIGNMVFVYGRLTFPATADTHVNLIGGLPFTAANQNYAQSVNAGSVTGLGATNSLPVKNSTTFTMLNATTAGQWTNMQLSGQTITFSMMYPVV